MNDDRVRTRQCPSQPREVLVVVERVAAGPVDQPDVRIGQAPAVVVELLARVQQQVGDRGHRNEVAAPGSRPAGSVGSGYGTGASPGSFIEP